MSKEQKKLQHLQAFDDNVVCYGEGNIQVRHGSNPSKGVACTVELHALHVCSSMSTKVDHEHLGALTSVVIVSIVLLLGTLTGFRSCCRPLSFQ